ncbi:MAG: BamA/TamA family outer membrane protein [Gemmatimonadota bacterium]|nr:BamA/TamA family outer membrane protein [Gemmatimonadota bacterium]
MAASRKRLALSALIVIIGFAGPISARAQDVRCDPGDVEVKKLTFTGNHGFTDADLSKIIVTTPSGWARRILPLPFTERHCLDRAELPNDRARLIIFYRLRGYPQVTVDTALRAMGSQSVEVKFAIHEGPQSVLRSFIVNGLSAVRSGGELARGVGPEAGKRFDRILIGMASDTIARRLRNSGYPLASVRNSFALADGGLSAWDTLTVVPGPLTRIGKLNISVVPLQGKAQAIPTPVVRRVMGLKTGNLYREYEIIGAQRALYQTEAYEHVSIAPDTSMRATDSVINLDVTLSEAAMHAARLGAGYGTLDCFRLTGELSNYNFLRGARRLDLTTRVSKIGIGKPLNGAEGLCPQAKRDVFSDRLNYYVGTTLRQPVFFGLRTVPTLTIYSQRISEYNAYLRTTAIGGVASLAWQRWARTPVNFAYSLDLGRTEAQPALFCAVFNVCDAEARQRLQETQRLAVLSASVTRDNANSLLNPSHGAVVRFEARHSSPAIFSDRGLTFNKLVGDAARYWDAGGGNVLAVRIRGGIVFGGNFGAAAGFVPPQERLYAGGPTTVRGFAQNELGSVIYISNGFVPVALASGDTALRVADSVSTYRRLVPVGGNTLGVGNIELRLKSPVLPELLQWTLFTDAGAVWNRGGRVAEPVRFKITPGIQLTAFSPVGPVRAVIGYNPYARPAGPLYYEATAAEGGGLPCVSPNNKIVSHIGADSTAGKITQAEGVCPSTFRPAAQNSFRSRLTFSFAIGQAF